MAAVNPVPAASVDEADPKKPWKALIPVLFAALYAVAEAIQIATGDGAWDTDDTKAVVGALITAVVVYFVRNPKVGERRANGL
jgi:hypothetical protein